MGGDHIKQFFKKLIKRDRGAVSVFAILIILPIFLLNALFIDTMRIFSAERQIENAMDTAMRSTMASFNEKLADVGLFSYNGSQGEAQSDFTKYLNKQTYSSGELNNAFSMARPDIDKTSISVNNERNLVDLDVFEHQILESMKYQAPAQIGTEIFNLVSNSGLGDFDEDDADSIGELAESYEEIIDLAGKRNKKISDVQEEIEKYINIVNNDQLQKIVGPKNPNIDDEIPDNIKNMAGLIAYNDRYHELKDKDNDSHGDTNKEEEEKKEQEIDNYEKALGDLRDEHLDKFNQFRSSLSLIDNEIFGNKSPDNPGSDSAMDYNKQMDDLMDELNLDNLDVDEESQAEIDKMKKMVLEEDFFKDIYNLTHKLDNEFYPNQTMSEEEALEGGGSGDMFVELVDGFHRIIKNHKSPASSIKGVLQNKINDFSNDAQVLQEHMDDYEVSKDITDDQGKDLEDKEDEADAGYNDLWNLITGAEDLANDQDNYDELKSIISQYDAATGDDGKDDPGRLQFIKDAINRFKQFIAFVGEFPESFRNQLYVNEYIMANYGTSEPYSLDPSSGSYLYENKKAQFITYGHTTAGVNYLSFLKDIAMLLFVTSLIDYVLFKGGFAGPWGFLRAVVFAFGDAADGIRKLTSENEYPWRPLKISGNITTTMPLFLRIFMLMKSTTGDGYNDKKLRRLQAAVTLDTGAQLDEYPSYIKGKVNGEVDLLFIPELAHLIPNQSGSLSGKTYTIEKEKVYSY